jgi:hypothetical protein
MGTEQGRDGQGEERDEPARRGMSWGAMLGWILAAFVLAGIVAYWLVTPFFRH